MKPVERLYWKLLEVDYMVNVRDQVLAGLQTITPNVKTSYPEGNSVFPLLTYAEITNVCVRPGHERIEFQVDAWTRSFNTCLELVDAVNSVMEGIGFRRTYVSPDSVARAGNDLYHKAMNYVGHVNSCLNNFMNI